MKTITFDEARAHFDQMFELAAAGEMVVISKNQKKVTVRAFAEEVAPSGYFESDYDLADAREMNALASHGPQTPLP